MIKWISKHAKAEAIITFVWSAQEEGLEITANSLHPGSISTNLLRHQTFVEGKFSNLPQNGSCCCNDISYEIVSVKQNYPLKVYVMEQEMKESK